jgi:hypothetical protein
VMFIGRVSVKLTCAAVFGLPYNPWTNTSQAPRAGALLKKAIL